MIITAGQSVLILNRSPAILPYHAYKPQIIGAHRFSRQPSVPDHGSCKPAKFACFRRGRFPLPVVWIFVALLHAICVHRDGYAAKCTELAASGEQDSCSSFSSFSGVIGFSRGRLGVGILDYRPMALFYRYSKLRLEKSCIWRILKNNSLSLHEAHLPLSKRVQGAAWRVHGANVQRLVR